MGMGFQAISRFGAPPLFQSLVAQGTVINPTFSFKLATSGSELYIGGSNPALYTGSFTCTPVTRQAYWQVDMPSVKVNGTTVTTNLSAVVDTGTTLIVGDATNVAKVYSSIPGAQKAPSIGPGFYTGTFNQTSYPSTLILIIFFANLAVPCHSIPSVSLTFGGRSFPISAATFNRGTVSSGSSSCVGAIVASDVASSQSSSSLLWLTCMLISLLS
jgi:cathepsin D